MSYQETMTEINKRRQKIMSLRAEMRTLQTDIEPEEITNYKLSVVDGEVTLASLFGDKDTLFMIHNMGKSCPSCTQWADGFNGVLDHLQDRAAFVVSSPDAPRVQAEFAAGRGWRFRMVSHQGTDFAKAMGYFKDGYWPGVSVLRKQGDRILRVSDSTFGPGDDFNSVYSFLAMTPEGGEDWEPKYAYN